MTTERFLSMKNARILVVSVFIAWLCWQIASAYPGTPTPDTCRQLAEGLASHYTNWKPALYSWFLGTADTLFPDHGIAALFLLQTGGVGLGVLAITCSLIRKHICYSLLIFVLPLLFTQKGMCIHHVGNDALAAACYLCFIGAAMLTREVNGRGERTIGFAFCIGFAFVGLALRHNALPLMFLLIFWACRRMNRSVSVSALASTGILAALAVAGALVTYGALKVEPSFPLKSPFANDIVNLDILEGRWSEICTRKHHEQLSPPPRDVPTLGRRSQLRVSSESL